MTKRVRVLSNVKGLGSGDDRILNEVFHSNGTRIARTARLLLLALKARSRDVAFVECQAFDSVVLAFLFRLLGIRRCQLLSADLVLRKPQTWYSRGKAMMKKWILRRVDCFILYHKSIEGYERWYGIEGDRVTYIPFKVNNPEVIARLVPSEGEYVFSTGLSERDWMTLARAARGVRTPLVVSTPTWAAARRMGMAVRAPRANDFGEGARVMRDDGDVEGWLKLMSGAKFVVLPIDKDAIAASGISTYLMAMALGKCVVISEGPSTLGLVDSGEAVVVPPGDAEALRMAMKRVDEDEEFRKATAARGLAYARSCGDATRLHRDFGRTVVEHGLAARKRAREPGAMPRG